MAACDLKVELDQPDQAFSSGSIVTGTVVVVATDTVNCKGLTVTSRWATHGRGNIDTGDVDQTVLFQGTWEANQTYRYPFKLNVAQWPPTYYGNYLNVSHYVKAQASVPWAFDPKQETEFVVVANTAPEDLQPTKVAAKPHAILKWVIAPIVLLLFIPLIGVAILFLLPLVLVGGGIYWFFAKYLPKRMTGQVECSASPMRLAPGEIVKGSLAFTPQRDLTINEITWKVECKEKCTSGSGSNRTTHYHSISECKVILAESSLLPVGKPQKFDFEFPVPQNAPSSVKLTDNELIWTGEVCIDIPRWPDWKQTFDLTIVPSGISSQGTDSRAKPALNVSETSTPSISDELSFDDVCKQIRQADGNNELLKLVADAVRGLTFNIRVDLQGRMFQAPGESTVPGLWYLARERKHNSEVCLLWPKGLAAPNSPQYDWQGTAKVIGCDIEHNRLLLCVETS